MAESHFPFSGGPAFPHQPQEMPVPDYQQNHFDLNPGFRDPPYNSHHYGFASPLPNGQRPASSQQLQHPQHPPYQWPVSVASPPVYMGASGGLFPYGTAEIAGPPQSYHPDPNMYPGYEEDQRNASEMFSTQNVARHHLPGMDYSGYVAPPVRSPWVQPMPTISRRPNRYTPDPPPFHRFDATHDERRDNMGNLDDYESRHVLSPSRRASYQRPPQRSNQGSINQERRQSQPIAVPESNGSPRPPTSRVRRQRTGGHPSFRARMLGQTEHPNVPTAAEMQILRDKLRHFLPNELPEGIDVMCDICQKDYATKYVDPTEDDEVAIQLPCKHVFGEYCINTWFDTCKKHKNKITCPMCRKVLVEPRSRVSLSGRQFVERIQREESSFPFFDSVGREERERLMRMLESREGEFTSAFPPRP